MGRLGAEQTRQLRSHTCTAPKLKLVQVSCLLLPFPLVPSRPSCPKFTASYHLQWQAGVRKQVQANAAPPLKSSAAAPATVRLFLAPRAPGDAAAHTALSVHPHYTSELFDRFPPLEFWRAADLQDLKKAYQGREMTVRSPTLEELQAMGLMCYEQYVIYTAYSMP